MDKIGATWSRIQSHGRVKVRGFEIQRLPVKVSPCSRRSPESIEATFSRPKINKRTNFHLLATVSHIYTYRFVSSPNQWEKSYQMRLVPFIFVAIVRQGDEWMMFHRDCYSGRALPRCRSGVDRKNFPRTVELCSSSSGKSLKNISRLRVLKPYFSWKCNFGSNLSMNVNRIYLIYSTSVINFYHTLFSEKCPKVK